MASDIVSALTTEDRKTIHDLLNNECTLRMPDALTDRFIDLGRVVTLRRCFEAGEESIASSGRSR